MSLRQAAVNAARGGKHHMSREVWLLNMIEALRPMFETAGFPFPETVHVSIGFPSSRALSTIRPRIGECWRPICSPDRNPHIFISPVIVDGLRAADVLVHELTHAATPGDRHTKGFLTCMRAVGLEGKPTATHAGEDLARRLNELIERVGTYPHVPLDPKMLEKKKQTTRLIKVVCPMGGDEEESAHGDYIVRMSRKTIDELGTPLCPHCQEAMEEGD